MLQEQEEDKLITALQREGGAIHSSVIHRLSHYVHCEHMDNQHHRANPQKKTCLINVSVKFFSQESGNPEQCLL